MVEVRTITKPAAGRVKVYLDGIEQASGWSVDTRTSPLDVNLSGIATGQQLTWNGTALVPVTEPFDVGVHLPDLSTAGALLAEIVLARPQIYSSYRAEWLACA